MLGASLGLSNTVSMSVSFIGLLTRFWRLLPAYDTVPYHGETALAVCLLTGLKNKSYTVQWYSTVRYSTVQYSTVQYSKKSSKALARAKNRTARIVNLDKIRKFLEPLFHTWLTVSFISCMVYITTFKLQIGSQSLGRETVNHCRVDFNALEHQDWYGERNSGHCWSTYQKQPS